MESKINPFENLQSEVIEHLRIVTKSRKVLFTFSDAVKYRELATPRIKVLIDAFDFLKKQPLNENDYFKYINSYFEHGIKLNEKYFRHDLDKLNDYYNKIDKSKNRFNPFNIDKFQNYVLFMCLKLKGEYLENDNEIFNVKNIDHREYNPLTKIPSVIRGVLPFKVKEYDIRRAFPSFIDIELNTDFKELVYQKLSKSNFAMYLNSNNETEISITDARKGLFTVYGDLVDEIITEERYNEKGKTFKHFAKYEFEYIQKFVESNNVTNYVRLHDGIFVLENLKCENLEFDKVGFAIKECIKPKVLNNIVSFYEFDENENVYTSPTLYADFLKQEKFLRVQSPDDKIQLLKDSNNVIDFFNHKTDLVSFLESEINEPNCDDVRDKIAKDNTNVLQQSLTLLEPIKLEYYKDSKQSFGLPFQNGFYYFDSLDKMTIKRKEYNDVKGFFAPHQIQKREFQYTDEVGVYETFLKRIITGVKNPNLEHHQKEIQFINSIIGYFSHNYKSQTQTPCIVLTDEGANDETRNGGRGKTLVANGLNEVTKILQKGGNEFVVDYIHNFADLDESFNCYVLDDVPANFKYNELYTNITSAIQIQPKGSKGRKIDFVDSPKFLITTNWLLRYEENDTSTHRRFIECKIKPYYNISNTPKDEFKQTFFEDWDSLEWNKFYSFIFRCVHAYLTHGIQRIQYNKTDDNYKALFGSDVREQEMERIIEIITRPIVHGQKVFTTSFNVSDFLNQYNKFDNPLKGEKLFTTRNTKKYIDAYLLKHKNIKYSYGDLRRWYNYS